MINSAANNQLKSILNGLENGHVLGVDQAEEDKHFYVFGASSKPSSSYKTDAVIIREKVKEFVFSNKEELNLQLLEKLSTKLDNRIKKIDTPSFGLLSFFHYFFSFFNREKYSANTQLDDKTFMTELKAIITQALTTIRLPRLVIPPVSQQTNLPHDPSLNSNPPTPNFGSPVRNINLNQGGPSNPHNPLSSSNPLLHHISMSPLNNPNPSNSFNPNPTDLSNPNPSNPNPSNPNPTDLSNPNPSNPNPTDLSNPNPSNSSNPNPSTHTPTNQTSTNSSTTSFSNTPSPLAGNNPALSNDIPPVPFPGMGSPFPKLPFNAPFEKEPLPLTFHLTNYKNLSKEEVKLQIIVIEDFLKAMKLAIEPIQTTLEQAAQLEKSIQDINSIHLEPAETELSQLNANLAKLELAQQKKEITSLFYDSGTIYEIPYLPDQIYNEISKKVKEINLGIATRTAELNSLIKQLKLELNSSTLSETDKENKRLVLEQYETEKKKINNFDKQNPTNYPKLKLSVAIEFLKSSINKTILHIDTQKKQLEEKNSQLEILQQQTNNGIPFENFQNVLTKKKKIIGDWERNKKAREQFISGKNPVITFTTSTSETRDIHPIYKNDAYAALKSMLLFTTPVQVAVNGPGQEAFYKKVYSTSDSIIKV